MFTTWTARLVAIRRAGVGAYVAPLETADGAELEFEFVVGEEPSRVVRWSREFDVVVNGMRWPAQVVLNAVYESIRQRSRTSQCG